ncbi:hypothetical protein [Corynebacterium sanguinis]|uniref:hypothetical protein n=1 Tax=Corynebacterium sanguinis TaxID=2594913 RepID=UPI00223BC7CE|nr:hypothetical protein [Corynebacterium sanguinis]MCT1414662.1 hypothetical protein [Corynebacterium sanguinis]
MNERYEIDHDWLAPDDSPATVRLTVTGAHARQAVLDWLDDLPADPLGTRGRGGWMVQEVTSAPEEVVLGITSGGQDVAESLEAGTAEAFEVLDALGCELRWEQRPRG